MNLKDSLVDIVRNKGIEILENAVVLNMLNDYSAFKENPSYRFIYNTLLHEGVIAQAELSTNRNDKIAYTISKRTGINQGLIQDVLDAVYFAYDNKDGLSIAQYEERLLEKIEIEDTHCDWFNISIDLGKLKVIGPNSFKITVFIFGDMASDLDVTLTVYNHSDEIICNKIIASYCEAYFAASEEVEGVCNVESLEHIGRIVIDAVGTGFSFLDLFGNR